MLFIIETNRIESKQIDLSTIDSKLLFAMIFIKFIFKLRTLKTISETKVCPIIFK